MISFKLAEGAPANIAQKWSNLLEICGPASISKVLFIKIWLLSCKWGAKKELPITCDGGIIEKITVVGNNIIFEDLLVCEFPPGDDCKFISEFVNTANNFLGGEWCSQITI